jgi:iron complex outermembrane receptor protein
MFSHFSRTCLLAGASTVALFALSAPAFAAASADAAAPADQIRNADDIVVTATKVNQSTPITASVHTFEPQAIVSRSIIENSISPAADYSAVILLTPGASLAPSSGNGVGLGDTKITLRGFVDGQYNMTYDGIPFGDSNDPTHHSTSYFPNGTYERIIVDRGPGSATDLGQSSYGGNIHLISREATDKFFIEGQGVYGSFNTSLERLTVNSGSIARLGGLKIIAVGEYKQTDGALTNQPGWWANGFIKAELPIGTNAKFSILGNYNQSLFNQSDAAGGSTLAQQALFGKNFGGVTPDQAAASGYTNARTDWNWQNKTTDMEIARLQWDVTSNLSFDNKAYTYFYKNFTISTNDSIDPCNLLNTATQCSGSTGSINAKAAPLSGLAGVAGAIIPGDVLGYTKLNQYRTSGDIATVTWKNPLGILKAGVWYEHSASHRYGYTYDFSAASAVGAVSNYNFDFAKMSNFYSYSATDTAAQVMLNGQPVPSYVKYDENTSWDQIQGFAEMAFKAMDDKLTITPGIKVQNFTRKINTAIAAQTSRVGIVSQESFKPTLPYLTVNYLLHPNMSIYGQFAKGFVIPALSATLESGVTPLVPVPNKTTNFQAGFVYAGDKVNVDTDAYYITTSSTTTLDPITNNVTVSPDQAVYQGIEGQISYVVRPGLTAIANGTLMSAVNDVTHMWLAKAPNRTALLGAVYNTGVFKASFLWKYTGREWADAANLIRIAPYTYGVASGSVTYGKFTIGLTVNNVFDSQPIVVRSASNNASTLYIYQPRRSYLASVKAKF